MRKNTLSEEIERMKYLSEYDLNEGFGRNLAAATMMTAASLLPMKSQANTNTNPNFGKDKIEMVGDSINSQEFQKQIKKLERDGYKAIDNSDIFIVQARNKPIKTVSAVGETDIAAQQLASKKANNPRIKFTMKKKINVSNIEYIIFYVQ